MRTERKKYERFVRRSSRAAKEKGYLEGVPLVDDPGNIEFAPRTLFREIAEKEFGEKDDRNGKRGLAEPLGDRIPAGSELLREYETDFPWRGSRRTVYVFRVHVESGYVIRSYTTPLVQSLRAINFLLETAMGQSSQTLCAEHKALRKLKRLVSDINFDSYILTGILYEQGRSGVKYIVRKNRPILAFRDVDNDDNVFRSKFLCALCLHPFGYHRDSFAGVMCPTDDVIAQLLLIRSDEPFLWRKSNQHLFTDVRSGVGI